MLNLDFSSIITGILIDYIGIATFMIAALVSFWGIRNALSLLGEEKRKTQNYNSAKSMFEKRNSYKRGSFEYDYYNRKYRNHLRKA